MNAMTDTLRGAHGVRPAPVTTGDAELPLSDELLRRLRESGL